jgi:hypothetical protein
MAYFFDLLDFPEGSRLTGVWNNTWVDQPFGGEIASGVLIALGDGQDPDVESDFTSSHLPFHTGGLHGVFPDGSGWIFTLQKAPDDASTRLAHRDDPWWVLDDAVDRALDLNPDAELVAVTYWTPEELVAAYEEEGVAPAAVSAWSVADLLTGLLAECCGVPLGRIVAGRRRGCAFPGEVHVCQHDVFQDVFATWAAPRD